MQVKSIHKYARISAFKAREVTRSIQGLPATDALNVLRFVPKKAARLVEKTLSSAIANAENNNNLRSESLVVQEAVVGEGPTLKRFRPRARGSAGSIRKRTSHIRIILTDEIEIKRREEQPKKNSRKTTAKATAKAGDKPQARVAKTPQAPKAEAPEPAQESEVKATPAAEAAETPAAEESKTETTKKSAPAADKD